MARANFCEAGKEDGHLSPFRGVQTRCLRAPRSDVGPRKHRLGGRVGTGRYSERPLSAEFGDKQLSFPIGLGHQFAFHVGNEILIVLERFRISARRCERLQNQSVSILPELVQGYCALPEVQRVSGIAGCKLGLAVLYDGRDSTLRQALAFPEQPFAPGRLVDVDILQERALVELDSRGNRRSAVVPQQPVEPHRVGLERARREQHRFSLVDDHVRSKMTTEPQHGLAQVVPRPLIAAGAP